MRKDINKDGFLSCDELGFWMVVMIEIGDFDEDGLFGFDELKDVIFK